MITSLDLTFLEKMKDSDLATTLNQLKNLSELNLTHTNITSLSAVAPSKTLTTLILAKCYKLKPTTFLQEIVDRFPELKVLSVADCGSLDMNSKSWELIHKLKLKTLNLNGAFPWPTDGETSAKKLHKVLKGSGCTVLGLQRFLPFGMKFDDDDDDDDEIVDNAKIHVLLQY